jgi:hypothetical protein
MPIAKLINIVTMATQIALLPEIDRLSPQVIRILGGNPGKASQGISPTSIHCRLLTLRVSSHCKVSKTFEHFSKPV